MRWLHIARLRLRSLLRRGRVEDELTDEIRFQQRKAFAKTQKSCPTTGR